MKKFCLFAVVLLCFGLGVVKTREAYSAAEENVTEENVTLAEVLQKSAQVYDVLQSYSGTTTVVSESVVSSPLVGEMKLKTETDAHIHFTRPNKIRIDGHTDGNRKFSIISDGPKAWLSWDLQNDGKLQESPNVQQSLLRMKGVARNAATHIPSILLKLDWGFPVKNMEGFKLTGHEVIHSIDCYKIVREDSRATESYWIDSNSFFLRQYKKEQDEDQVTNSFNALPEEIKARLKKGLGKMPDSKTKSTSELHTFTIESTSAALDEKLFQNPTSKD